MKQIGIHNVVVFSLLLLSSPLPLHSGNSGTKPPNSARGIFQLIESRNGKKSCWGVIIQLGELSFKESIDQDELTITDAKYDRDMKSIVTWTVDKARKRLTITFKQGMGDFGTGDDVTVRIRGRALNGEPEQDYTFTITTDIL